MTNGKRPTREQTGRMVRMRDVAELAGVGTMTVSRVLNRTAPVSEGTSIRVFQAIEQLNYKPNQLARALRGSPSNTIGVMVPYLHDSFFAECTHAIGLAARERSYSVILTMTQESRETVLEEARQMILRRVDGLLIIPSGRGALELNRPELQKVPIVTMDRPISGFDSVVVENASGTRMAVEHLIHHGHRQIAFIGLTRSLYTMRLRFEGYAAAMQDAGFQIDAHFSVNTQQLMTSLLRELLAGQHPPTAIFAANGLTTRFALESLARLGVTVPDHVALIGFDDFQLADILQPALTVVRQPTHELGQKAAELLFHRLDADISKHTPKSIMLSVELVLRRSCGCSAGVHSASMPPSPVGAEGEAPSDGSEWHGTSF